MSKSFLVLAAAVLASACAHVSSNTDLVQVVRTKASFELSCPEPQLNVTPLTGGQTNSNGFAATNQKSYGVEGCGKRASYYAYCTNMMGQESCDAMQSSQPTGGGAGR
jgi:hypothetical protein